MIDTNYWVHKNVQIGHTGVTEPERSTTYVNSPDDILYINEDDENIGYTEYEETLDQQDDSPFRNVKNDVTIEGSPAWKGILCSPFDARNSHAMMKSHIWPGAYAVAYEWYVYSIHL